MIESDIENQLSSLAMFMSGEQLNEQKKKMLEQYKTSAVKQQFLQSWLAQEILYRQAMEDGLAEKAEVKKLLDGLARSVLSQQLMNQQIAEKIHITETDLKTYYEANKEKYVEPANEEEGTAERQKSFDEVREEVMMTLVNEKRQDVQQEYIGKMMDKYNVIIHMSSLIQGAPQTPSSAFVDPKPEPNEK